MAIRIPDIYTAVAPFLMAIRITDIYTAAAPFLMAIRITDIYKEIDRNRYKSKPIGAAVVVQKVGNYRK